MITPAERQFLTALSAQKQGRTGYDPLRYEAVMETVGGLLKGGLIKERRLNNLPGFQITEAGKQYLGGVVS